MDIRDIPGIKHVCNFWEAPFKANSLDNIYSRHALEHLTLEESRQTLKKWCEWLKPERKLELMVPNLVFHANQLIGAAKGRHRLGDIRHAIAGFYGWHDGGSESTHRTGWTMEFLEAELVAAGFRIIRWISNEPASLHVMAEIR